VPPILRTWEQRGRRPRGASAEHTSRTDRISRRRGEAKS
jgi:hypothetical protein